MRSAMNAILRVYTCLFTAVAVSGWAFAAGPGKAKPSAAPGAKAPAKLCPAALIDASKYPDLQAALDKLVKD